MSETTPENQRHSLKELIAESKKLAEQYEAIRQRMDELKKQIDLRAEEIKNRTPIWDDPIPPDRPSD